ncbi:hypothetical protein HU200_025142 [Digitaria exilis]|uniref:Pentatricopeptide repeat-containing protein n=1 Tax=Digitaria exilis TaxID=1010633 RepID=A0A835EWJ4_9POAL|nr:hypothetical protein HU200_025142 [Digitaria exilis]
MTAETHTEFISIFRKPRGGGGRRDLLRRVRRGRGVPYRHVRAHAVGDGVRSLTPTCAASAPHGDPLLFLAASRRGRAVALAIDTALYVLSRSRLFTHMWDLLHSTRRVCPGAVSARTAMVVLGRVAKVCCVRETVASFQRLLRMFRAIYLAALFNKLLRTLGQEQSMTDARNTFIILLSGWKSAEDAEMRKLGVEPDPMTYNSLIDCHGKNKDVHKALKLLDEMRDKDISPDVITYTRLIGGLGLIGQPDKAKDLLKEMHELGCYPDSGLFRLGRRRVELIALLFHTSCVEALAAAGPYHDDLKIQHTLLCRADECASGLYCSDLQLRPVPSYWPSSRLCRTFPASTAVSMTPRMTDAVWPTSHSFPGNVGPAGLILSRQLSRFSLHLVFSDTCTPEPPLVYGLPECACIERDTVGDANAIMRRRRVLASDDIAIGMPPCRAGKDVTGKWQPARSRACRLVTTRGRIYLSVSPHLAARWPCAAAFPGVHAVRGAPQAREFNPIWWPWTGSRSSQGDWRAADGEAGPNRGQAKQILFLFWSCTMQQASRASQGFSPGQPLYMIPQYFPYLSSGGTSIFRDRMTWVPSPLVLTAGGVPSRSPMLSARDAVASRRRSSSDHHHRENARSDAILCGVRLQSWIGRRSAKYLASFWWAPAARAIYKAFDRSGWAAERASEQSMYLVEMDFG